MLKVGRAQHVRISKTHDPGMTFTDGEIRIQFWNKKERTVRALKFGGMFWGAALVSIVIPILHFILVPGFFLAGPIVAFLVLGQESVVLGGEGTCPHCQAIFPIAQASHQFPLSDICTRCQNALKIEPI